MSGTWRTLSAPSDVRAGTVAVAPVARSVVHVRLLADVRGSIVVSGQLEPN